MMPAVARDGPMFMGFLGVTGPPVGVDDPLEDLVWFPALLCLIGYVTQDLCRNPRETTSADIGQGGRGRRCL